MVRDQGGKCVMCDKILRLLILQKPFSSITFLVEFCRSNLKEQLLTQEVLS